MAQPLGSPSVTASMVPARGPLQATKKKGCKQHKCSKWKGGKCCCGRE